MADTAERAFALKKGVTGASLAYGAEGHTLDLVAETNGGKQNYVTDNPIIIEALQGHPAVKSVAVETKTSEGGDS